MAGKCSSLFLKHVLNVIKGTDDEEKLRKHILDKVPAFDARIMEFTPDLLYEVTNNIMWRSLYDCYRNCVSSYSRHVLG